MILSVSEGNRDSSPQISGSGSKCTLLQEFLGPGLSHPKTPYPLIQVTGTMLAVAAVPRLSERIHNDGLGFRV